MLYPEAAAARKMRLIKTIFYIIISSIYQGCELILKRNHQTVRGEPNAWTKEGANQSEWRQEGEAKERFLRLQTASTNG